MASWGSQLWLTQGAPAAVCEKMSCLSTLCVRHWTSPQRRCHHMSGLVGTRTAMTWIGVAFETGCSGADRASDTLLQTVSLNSSVVRRGFGMPPAVGWSWSQFQPR